MGALQIPDMIYDMMMTDQCGGLPRKGWSKTQAARHDTDWLQQKHENWLALS